MMYMLSMRRGKNPRPIFFLKIYKHKFGRDVMTSANFGLISFTGFGNTGVQSYSLASDKAHRAYNSFPTGT